MALRDRLNVTSLLLASTALLTFGAWPQASAEPHNGSFVIAQAAPAPEGEKDKKGQPPGKRPEQKAPPTAPQIFTRPAVTTTPGFTTSIRSWTGATNPTSKRSSSSPCPR